MRDALPHTNRMGPFRTLALLLPWTIALAGCGGDNDALAPDTLQEADSAQQFQEEYLDFVVDNLNRLDEFDPGPMFHRVFLIAQAANQDSELLGSDRLMLTCPQPDILREILSRLNEWAKLQEPPADWRPDPMIETVPRPLWEASSLSDLDAVEFGPYDGFVLREAVWCRDISNWARGNRLKDLDVAGRLFDWTIRNIQLEAEREQRTPQFAWETLLLGRGTAAERAWVFSLLARQQGIDVVLLAVRAPKSYSGNGLWWWAAVVDEDHLHLYDPALGVPIPAPDGVSLDADGRLAIRPATLEEVRNDDGLLRQLDIDPSRPYPVVSDDMEHVVALIEAAPVSLSRRMRLLEDRLPADKTMVLTTSPSRLADRLKANPRVAEAKIWPTPLQTMAARRELPDKLIQQHLNAKTPLYALEGSPLFQGRVLYFKGRLTGPDGASRYYQRARPADWQTAQDLAQEEEALSRETIRRDNKQLAEREVQRRAALFIDRMGWGRRRGKSDATYWLGVLSALDDNDPAAIDYLAKRTLEASPHGPWTPGAQYNLAQTYERERQYDKAIEYYMDAAQQRGPNATVGFAGQATILRARWLNALRPREPSQAPPEQVPPADQREPTPTEPTPEPVPTEPIPTEPAPGAASTGPADPSDDAAAGDAAK